MKENKMYREEAWQALDGHWVTMAGITFVYIVITLLVSGGLSFMIPLAGPFLSWCITFPLMWGFTCLFLHFWRTRQEPVLSDLFIAFNNQQYLRVLGTFLLMWVYQVLWSLLFIIPGIIKSYSYAMTPFILRDHPEDSDAIEKSMAMMQGNKMKLFLLDLSFVGWFMLCVLTCGLASLWVMPYWYTARAAFYDDLCGNGVDSAIIN